MADGPVAGLRVRVYCPLVTAFASWTAPSVSVRAAVLSVVSVPLMVTMPPAMALVVDSGSRVSALIDATLRPPAVVTFTSRPVPSRRAA
jgi:hypothetical protein